jgi:serine/threonine-protein kinase
MARAYERLNNWEAAEAVYQKAIDVRPDYWGNYIWLAQFYLFSRNQYQDAINLYGKAVALAPQNPLPHAYLCGAYIEMGSYNAAVESCSESLRLQPQMAAYINLGNAYFDLREFPQAAEAFKQGMQLDKAYYKVVGDLARAYSWIPEKRADAANLYLNAISLVNKGLEVDPADADRNVMVALYHAMLGHRTEALSHLQIALKERPKDLHYQEIAAVIHNQFGDRAVAIAYLERALAGGYSLTEIEAEIELDSLRQDPAIQTIIANRKRKADKQ